ncbi:MAG: lipoprotein-releasing ABC transporter permease subunit [Pseudomonadales bacterium]|nr:lipoprotein-releasing ABC transporter permease subunit [Pseudomonadales bacterium]
MSSPWRWMIARRYTSAGAADRLLSFMSLLSISGLVLGVAVLVVVLSVMNGFERELRTRVLGVLAHAVIFDERGFEDWTVAAALIDSHPDVEAVAPFSEGSGLVVVNDKVSGVVWNGIDPALESRVSILGHYVVSGALDSLTRGSYRAAIGTTLAARLGVVVGDKVTLVLPDTQLTLAGPIPRTRRFEIAALFNVGADVDKGQLLMNIEDADRLRRIKHVDGIRLRLDDLFKAPEVVRDILSLPEASNWYGSTWMRRYGNLYDAIQLQKSTMFLLLLMLVAVAAFNVVSNLVMTVNDKRGDIAILRTLGASPGSIMRIFIMHGVLVGAVGVVIGIMVGVVVSLYLGPIYTAVDNVLGLGLMDEYFIHYLPSRLLAGDVVVVGVVSLVICLLSTIYPAWKAATSHPVEALQYDA